MGFAGLTSEIVSDFASRPFVRAAIAHPSDPYSVLSFYFGFDCRSPEAPSVLRDGTFMATMSPYWYGGHEDYDALCRTFSDVVRSAGRNELDGDGWSTVDGRMARTLLCDQLSRNCFRGTDEAFAYDDVGLDLAQGLAKQALSSEGGRQVGGAGRAAGGTEGEEAGEEIYGTYACICTLPLMHSEALPDHDLALDLIEWGRTVSPEITWDEKRGFVLQHKVVLERFGRYPHRNPKKGRESTPEEIAWLSSDEAPRWTKSQG